METRLTKIVKIKNIGAQITTDEDTTLSQI